MLSDVERDLSNSRLEHAKRCLKGAHILLTAGDYEGAANRAYYAAFHAMRAVLILDGFDSKKHSGIIAKFRELYIKTNLFDKEFSNAITALFRLRTASDYDDLYVVTMEETIDRYEQAERIVEIIADYLAHR